MKKMVILLFASVLFSGCVSQNVLPVPDKSYVPDIQLKDLAEKMKNAVDPNGVYRSSKSYYQKQELMINGKDLTIEFTFKSPDKSKSVMSLDGKVRQTTISNGAKSWDIAPGGKKTELAGLDLERIKLVDAMAAPSGTILDVFGKVEFAGEEKVLDSPCYILLCQQKSEKIAPMAFFVSKSDYLTRKIITLRNKQPYIAEIRKYSLVNGVMIATETEMDINSDGKKELMTVTDYKLNVDVPDTEFE